MLTSPLPSPRPGKKFMATTVILVNWLNSSFSWFVGGNVGPVNYAKHSQKSGFRKILRDTSYSGSLRFIRQMGNPVREGFEEANTVHSPAKNKCEWKITAESVATGTGIRVWRHRFIELDGGKRCLQVADFKRCHTWNQGEGCTWIAKERTALRSEKALDPPPSGDVSKT